MIKILEDKIVVTVDIQNKNMPKPMSFTTNFKKEDDSFRFWSDISRKDFEEYLKVNGLSEYTQPYVLRNKVCLLALKELELLSHELYDSKDLTDLRKWAGEVLDKAAIIKSDIEDKGFKATEVEVTPDHKITVTPCYQGFEIKSFDDVEWYLTSDFLVDGGDSIYKLAADILNYKGLEKAQEREENKLQEFYEEKIAEFYNHKSQNEWTKEENEAFGYFSDWHKDVYGHRPHPGQNECQKIINEEFEYYNGRYSGEIEEEEDFEK